MNEQAVRDILSGRRRGAGPAVLRGLLAAGSAPYAAATWLRRRAYRAGILPSRPAGAPVICVGNLTVGGAGKTPMAAWVARLLARAGRRPAILTRGYKAGAGESDEALLLRAIAGAPVVVNADRAAGARAAIAAGADVLVMDDGFQHLRLRRDLDIVLVDATCPFGFGHCLPRGLLREPASALADAGAVVITRADQAGADALAALRARLAKLAPRASIHSAVHRPAAIIDPTGARRPPAELAGKRVYAFCGLANPLAFMRTLESLGASVSESAAFADHHAYRPADLERVWAEAERAGAMAITTQKDYVKLRALVSANGGRGDLPAGEPGAKRATAGAARGVWQLAVEMEITDGATELEAKVLAAAAGTS